jgi:hypothetical protein
MTLPAGTISMSQVNTELGRSSTAAISLGETAVRTLAGVASGTISMSNLQGKSNVTFTPDGGTAGSPASIGDFATYPASASRTITSSQTATWTWTRSGSTQGGASIASGGTGTSITFTLPSSNTAPRSTTYSVSATASGVTKYWTVTLDTETNQ